MKHFSDENDIPYENTHFEDYEYRQMELLDRSMLIHDDDLEDTQNEDSLIKHFQD